ncbi:ketopantoate reductase family protein [Pseudoruegeria sp. HB172150]|uniref:ketopantoate reductase family protein n=1 Tax=Pseudoruegeria sp. HB172150 TaxID=2721164 RepID=UPI001554DC5D|nr:ketopantoate reductase family protein [Pseudoruegeria sp. HB172150]
MRFIIYGVGAIGGTLAAALTIAGRDVVGIARGRMLDAIRSDGLTLISYRGSERAEFPCVSSPAEIEFRPDDCILLTMKGQDTAAALDALRLAGVREQAIFCCQNGVANERAALRVFPNVHGVTVMMPATYLEPGKVSVTVEPRFGMYDIGRYPHGTDSDDAALAEALEAANIACFVMEDVMASKYGKLLLNTNNILEAALGHGTSKDDLRDRVRAEASAVYDAAGIAWRNVGFDDGRREAIRQAKLPDAPRIGGSTSQSLARGAGSIETDYLNGEISLLGRLHGVPTPLNDALTFLSTELLASGKGPGSMSLAELEARLAA